MSLLRKAIFLAAKRAAFDPQVQAQAKKVYCEYVVPRAQRLGASMPFELEEAHASVKKTAQRLERIFRK